MGTNYYTFSDDPCDHCHGTGKQKVHIGKSSMGWKFIFTPFRKSYESWKEFLLNRIIKDEYGDRHKPEEFFELVENKQKAATVNYEKDFPEWREHEYEDEKGFRISKHDDFC